MARRRLSQPSTKMSLWKFCLGVWLDGTKGARLCSSSEGWRKLYLYSFFMLWYYGILFLFICWVVELPLLCFCILELIVRPRFIVIFQMSLNIFRAVGKWAIFSDDLLSCSLFCWSPKAMYRSLPCIWVHHPAQCVIFSPREMSMSYDLCILDLDSSDICKVSHYELMLCRMNYCSLLQNVK
jgi:hypothetical protein